MERMNGYEGGTRTLSRDAAPAMAVHVLASDRSVAIILDEQEGTGQGILRTNQGKQIDQNAFFEYASGIAPQRRIADC